MEKSIQKLKFFIFVAGLSAVVVLISPNQALPQGKPGGAAAPGTTMLLKPGSEMTVGDRSLPDPLQPLNHLIENSVVEKSPLKQTNGCKDLQVWESVVVPEDHWHSFASPLRRIARQVGVLAVASQSNCVRVGHPMRVAAIDSATGISTLLGWFMPTSIVGPRAAFKKQEEPLLISGGLYGSNTPAVFVTGRVIMNAAMGAGAYTPRMTGVRMINRDQMETAIREGTTIVDVRAKKQFDIAHVKGATHVPYTVGPRMSVLDAPSNYAKSGDSFDIRRVKPDRQSPVVLLGEGPDSHEVYRAAVVLKSEGWKNILIFFEGFNYFSGMIWSTPALSNIVGVIADPGQLSDLLADKALAARVIDVRSDREYAEATIGGALLAPMKERDDLRYRRPSLNGQILMNYGDTWTPPANLAKTTPIVIAGSNTADWRSYKAALMAKAQGFSTVYWFRGGVDTWVGLAAEMPDKFAVARAPRPAGAAQ